MLRTTAQILILLVLPATPILSKEANGSDSVRFAFQFNPGDQYTVEKYQDIRIREGGRIQKREEKNTIRLKVRESQEDGYRLAGTFLTYTRMGEEASCRQDRSYQTDFLLNRGGLYRVPEHLTMPNLHSLPSFPDRAVQPGESWSAPARETMELGNVRVDIPLMVHYTYRGKEKIKDRRGEERSVDRIDYRYTFLKQISIPGLGLEAIQGFSSDRLYFDREQGIPLYDSNRLLYRFQFRGDRQQEFAFRIESWYRKERVVPAEKKEEMVEEIRNNLKENRSITVKQSDEGISLEINDILFDTASSQLRPEARKEIEAISEVLKQYPDREIRVTGHTDSRGNPQANQILSEKRARSVVNQLVESHSIDGKRISYRGYGQTKPVAKNDTPEGRQKNRRVEILIVTD